MSDEDPPREDPARFKGLEAAAAARVAADHIMDMISAVIEERNVGIGFVIGIMCPPVEDEQGEFHQEFFYNTNAGPPSAVLGILGRCLSRAAREESRIENKPRIVDPNSGALPN